MSSTLVSRGWENWESATYVVKSRMSTMRSRLVEIDQYGERPGLSRLQCLAKRGTHPRDRIRVGAARRSPPVDALRNPLGETLKVSASPERGRISFSLCKMAVNAAKNIFRRVTFRPRRVRGTIPFGRRKRPQEARPEAASDGNGSVATED